MVNHGHKVSGRPKAVTLGEIARECGVSIPTVSLTLRGDTRCASPETRQRIKATAQEMGYDPAAYASARRLVSQHTGRPMLNHVIGTFFPSDFFYSTQSYYATIFQHIIETLYETEFSLLTNYRLREDQDPGKRLPLIYRRGEVDGLIVILSEYDFRHTLALLRSEPQFAGRPIVSLVYEVAGCSCVVADDFRAGYLAASHLLDLGHRNLLHFFSRHDPSPRIHRLHGFQRARLDRGLNPDRCLRSTVWKIDDPSSNGDLLNLLKAQPDITGLLLHNDAYASIIVKCLREAGYRIPQELSVVSFDDTDAVNNEAHTNILTTVHMPLAEIGAEGARLIVQRVTGEITDNVTRTLPVHLVERASTMPPRKK